MNMNDVDLVIGVEHPLSSDVSVIREGETVWVTLTVEPNVSVRLGGTATDLLTLLHLLRAKIDAAILPPTRVYAYDGTYWHRVDSRDPNRTVCGRIVRARCSGPGTSETRYWPEPRCPACETLEPALGYLDE